MDKDQLEAFARLVEIMDDLREKCPWDKEQTIQSLRPLSIEETYELADAIDKNDWQGIKEEIGDLMLHMVFYAKIASEQQQFTLTEALHAICDKLVSRHPHIYGDLILDDAEQVKQNWEKLKLKEGKRSILQGVPEALPAVMKAYRMQEKAKQVGFEWEFADDAWNKVKEELDEFHQQVITGSESEMQDEFGDVLFSLINYARYKDIDPEAALARSNRKFKQRFEYIEQHAERPLSEMTLGEMDQLWEAAKENGI